VPAQQQLKPDTVPSQKYHITLAQLPKITGLLLPEIYSNNNNNNNNKHEIKEIQKYPYWAQHTYYGKY
jgi:2'-5' RNA ligase